MERVRVLVSIDNLGLAIHLCRGQRPFVHAALIVGIGSMVVHLGIVSSEFGRRDAGRSMTRR